LFPWDEEASEIIQPCAGNQSAPRLANLEDERLMRIKKLRLKNGYKRFRDLTIDLGEKPARVVALVGPNGCGKSSVLDGLLYYQQAHGAIGNTGGREHSYHSMEARDSSSYQNVEVEFVDGSFNQMREARDKVGKGNTVFSFRSPYRYNAQVKISEIRSTSAIRLNSYGASDASSLDSKMEDNYRRLQAMVYRHMQERDVKPSEARSTIIGELNRSIRKCLDLEISSVGNIEAAQGTLYFLKMDHPKEFEFNVLSSGEKEVIDLLLDLYLRKEDYDDTIFLIDEPELHINTSIQGRLLAEIDQLVGETCQIWLTTHSIGFLRALQTQMKDRCQIIQFKGDYELASKPYVLTPMKVTAVAWRELFAVALDDLATLVSPKTIIYCEGRDKPGKAGAERGMDAQALNIIFAESHPDAMFVSSGGNTELDQRSAIAIAILGKVFPSVEVLVFKDRDMVSGKVANENDRQVYLKSNPQNHRVMKRFELENYLYDKEVLKAYCSGNNLPFDDAAYDAFVTNIVDQNLKDETGRIKNICGNKGSVNSEVFKVSLADYLTEDTAAFVELRDCIFARA
jgi:ABC-type cobalamin/Fe3+-siderophores transport system ATPase subunit